MTRGSSNSNSLTKRCTSLKTKHSESRSRDGIDQFVLDKSNAGSQSDEPLDELGLVLVAYRTFDQDKMSVHLEQDAGRVGNAA